jgi:Zn-finger nucleic acid-binding protein
MRDAQIDDCKLKTCPNCEGTWYPGEALGAVTDHSLSELKKSALEPTLVADRLEAVDLDKPVFCPVCSRPMMRYRYTMTCDVVLDECLDHGVWLDDGELGSLMTFLEELYRGAEDSRDRLSSGVTEKNLEYLEDLYQEEGGGNALSAGVLEALYQVHNRPR